MIILIFIIVVTLYVLFLICDCCYQEKIDMYDPVLGMAVADITESSDSEQ